MSKVLEKTVKQITNFVRYFKTTFKPIKFELKILSGEFQPKKILELVFGSMQEYHGFLEKLAGLII